MKKRLMMVAALLGTLFLGACVDNNETQSVTDVRNAKAEQLQARADMNNAEAQAKTIAANAEATLMAAKAQAQKAAAAKANAEAETIKKRAELVDLQKEALELQNEAAKVENQKAQAALEAALAELETTKKQAELELAQIAARMEQMEQEYAIAMLNLQAQLLEAQKQLVDYEAALAAAKTQAEKDALEAERLQLTILANDYANAVTELLDAQEYLASLQADLIEAEAELAGWDEAVKEHVAYQENLIARYESEIELYKQYTNYTESEDIDALQIKYGELEAKKGQLHDAYLKKSLELNQIDVDRTAADEILATIEEDGFYHLLRNYELNVSEDKAISAWEYPLSELRNSHFMSGFLRTFSIVYDTYENGEYTETYSGDSISLYTNKSSKDILALELKVNDLNESLKAEKESHSEELEILKGCYNGIPTRAYSNGGWGYRELTEGETIRNAVDSTLYLKAAYDKETDVEKKAEYKTLYEEALAVEQCLADFWIPYYENAVADKENQITAVNMYYDYFKNFDTNVEALQKKIDAYNEALLTAHAERIAAWKENRAAWCAYNAVSVEMDAISSVLYGGNGMNGAAYLESAIANRESWIAACKAKIEELQNVESQEQWIAQLELLIDAQKAVVKAKELAVADAKAALDAVMPETEE